MLNLELPRYKAIEALSKKDPGSISFSQGAVRVGGTPQAIKNHIASLMISDVADYYQAAAGLFPLREQIAKMLSERHHLYFDPEQIIVSHGSIGGLSSLCLTLLDEGDQVILPSPTYPSYQSVVRFSKAEPLFVEAFFERDEGWFFDVKAIESAVSPKTKMVILSNPSNPCGIPISQPNLLALKKLCEERGLYLVLDEVYDSFIYEGALFSGTPFVLESELIFRTGSFSKDFAMSGWRIGYIVTPKKLAHAITAVQDGNLNCASVVGQYAALFALKHKELMQETVESVKESLSLANTLLEPLVKKGHLSYIKPQAGIFLFIKTAQRDAEPLVMDLLKKARIAFVPGRDFGARFDCFRLCFAREKDLVQEGLTRLQDYFQIN